MNKLPGQRKSDIQLRDSLQIRLLLFFLGLSIVPLVVISVISYIQSQNALVDRIKEDLRTQTNLQGTMLSTFLKERKDNMVVLAGTARVRTMDPAKAVDAIEQYFKQWGLYENLGLYSLEGIPIYRTDQANISVADRDYFQNALDGETSFSDPVISRASGNIVFVVASPVVEGGKVVGVITGSIPTTIFTNYLNAKELGAGDGFLVNKNGYLITPSNHTEELLKLGRINERSELELLPDTSAVNSLLEGKSGIEEYTDVVGNTVIGAFLPVEGSTWGLVMEHSIEEVLASVFRLRILYFSAMVIAVIVVTLLSILISNNITRPILQIATLSRQISRGEIPEEEILITGRDEIALLGKSFQDILHYFQEIAGISEQLANGDLTATVNAHSEKDILGQSFSRMLDHLRDIIRQMVQHSGALDNSSMELAQTAHEVDGVTSQIATTITQVAKGTSQQSESIIRSASIVEELSGSVNDVAKGAQEQANSISRASQSTINLTSVIQQVSEIAHEVASGSLSAREAARKGSKTVQATLEEMQAIKQSVGLSSQKVEEMGARSGQIGVILTTIEDIASQTNMLALNAAIEAARAGESGKGFAVVADEVRKLAERVALSTHEIDDLIKSIQSSVIEANKAMVQGSAEVEKGVDLANQAGIALKEILTAADNVNSQAELAAQATGEMTRYADELVTEVDSVSTVVEKNTTSTEKMSVATNEVTQSVENIASISEENSAAAEEVSAATEELATRVEEVSVAAARLSELSQEMRKMVQKFKTD